MGGTLVAVATGGALGALGRYLLAGAVQRAAGDAFPWGTLSVNILGSLLLGILFGLVERGSFAPEFQALLAVGLLGSFTTFSTFSLESLTLIQSGDWLRAGLYVCGSVALGLAMAGLGMRLTTPVSP